MTNNSSLIPTRKIVNVGSVPQRSPFRYPGGKTWLVPFIRKWLNSFERRIEELIEPFAGGAVVGLTAAFEELAKRVTLVELDPDVAAVWTTILNGEGEWLANRIVNFRASKQSLTEALQTAPRSLGEKAFLTILKNRVQRGGILAPGAGLLKKGENGKGRRSRWYPETLKKRIMAIAELKHRISFIKGDGLYIMRTNVDREDVVFFLDPPYTIAAGRLYRFSEVDHEALFSLCSSVKGDFLMTYNKADEVRKLAAKFGFAVKALRMKSTHHVKKTELLIGRNLAWMS